MTDLTPAEVRGQALRLRMRAEIAERKHEHPTTVSDLRAGADALAAQRERPKIEIHIESARCMACGLPDHQCPTGGRLLR